MTLVAGWLTIVSAGWLMTLVAGWLALLALLADRIEFTLINIGFGFRFRLVGWLVAMFYQ